jgi:hypothetical protein
VILAMMYLKVRLNIMLSAKRLIRVKFSWVPLINLTWTARAGFWI